MERLTDERLAEKLDAGEPIAVNVGEREVEEGEVTGLETGSNDCGARLYPSPP